MVESGQWTEILHFEDEDEENVIFSLDEDELLRLVVITRSKETRFIQENVMKKILKTTDAEIRVINSVIFTKIKLTVKNIPYFKILKVH